MKGKKRATRLSGGSPKRRASLLGDGAPRGLAGLQLPLFEALEAPRPGRLRSIAGGRRQGRIPFNMALREILAFVPAELTAAGETWYPGAVQDMVCQIFTAAADSGYLELWERAA